MIGARWLVVAVAFASLVGGLAAQEPPKKWPAAKVADSKPIVVRNEEDVARVAAELNAALVEQIGPEKAKALEPAVAAAVDQVTRSMSQHWPEEDAPSDEKSRRWHETAEIAFSLSVLAAGGVVLGLLAWLRSKRLISAGLFLKLFVLVAVIASGVFVITAGYDQDQIGPMMGLLGTLVGYLLGKQEPKPAPEPQEPVAPAA